MPRWSSDAAARAVNRHLKEKRRKQHSRLDRLKKKYEGWDDAQLWRSQETMPGGAKYLEQMGAAFLQYQKEIKAYLRLTTPRRRPKSRQKAVSSHGAVRPAVAA